MFKSVLIFLGALLLLGACSDVALQSSQRAYPQFSLVGAPDRPVTFDLSIDGPAMDTIGPVEVGPEQRSTVLEIPAGRDREFSFVAQDDVYSGHAVASIAGGRETTVTVPIVPGPVFVDFDGGGLEPGPRIVQVRDLNVPETAVTDDEDGRVRDIVISDILNSDFGEELINFGYAPSRGIWVLERDDGSHIRIYDSWESIGSRSFDDSITLAPLPLNPEVADVTFRNELVAVAGRADLPRISFFELSGSFVENVAVDVQLSELLHPDSDLIQGVAFDSYGVLWAVAEIAVEDVESEPVLGLIRIDLEDELVDYVQLPEAQQLRDYEEESDPPSADLRVVEDSVYVISAAGRAGDPAVYRFDLDLNLLDTWGEITTEPDPQPGEFWGPRRFAATRNPEQLIVIDQTDDDPFMVDGRLSDGTGRLVEFQFGTTNGWQEFGRDEFGFFDTSIFIGEV